MELEQYIWAAIWAKVGKDGEQGTKVLGGEESGRKWPGGGRGESMGSKEGKARGRAGQKGAEAKGPAVPGVKAGSGRDSGGGGEEGGRGGSGQSGSGPSWTGTDESS